MRRYGPLTKGRRLFLLTDAGSPMFPMNRAARTSTYSPIRAQVGNGKSPPKEAREPAWNRNGRELFYRRGDEMMALDVTTEPSFSAGKPHLLFERRYLANDFPLVGTAYDGPMVNDFCRRPQARTPCRPKVPPRRTSSRSTGAGEIQTRSTSGLRSESPQYLHDLRD